MRGGCTRATGSRWSGNRRRPFSRLPRHPGALEHAPAAIVTGRRADSFASAARIGRSKREPPIQLLLSSRETNSSKNSLSLRQPADRAANRAARALNFLSRRNISFNSSLPFPFYFPQAGLFQYEFNKARGVVSHSDISDDVAAGKKCPLWI